MKTGWYVIAKYMHRTNYLCGPFPDARAATAMIEPVRRLQTRRDANSPLRLAEYGVTRKRTPLPPGSLPLDENYVRELLNDHQ